MKKAIGMLWLVALAAVGVAIFGNSVTSLPPAQPPTEAEVYAQLWAKCKERGLYYEVYCVQGTGCNAEARHDETSGRYMGHADGPTEAVQKLIKVLDGGRPNWPAARTEYIEMFNTGKVVPY